MNKQAFTLIELLVVVAIIGILSAVVLTSLSNARASAKYARGQSFDAQLRTQHADALVAEYLFEAGATTTDTSDYNHALSAGGNATIVADGYNNSQSASFDGTTDYFQTDAFGFSISDEFTVAMWVKLDNFDSTNGLLGLRHLGDPNFDFKITTNSLLYADIASASSWIQTAASSVGAFSAGQWHHVAVSVRNGSYALYMDGVILAETTVSAGTPELVGVGETIRLGTSAPTEDMDGMIDNVRIYSRAMH